MTDEEKRGRNSGFVAGAAVGTVGTAVMSNPITRWFTYNLQDEGGLFIKNLFDNLSRDAGNLAYRIYSVVTNTIMANPMLLAPIGGIIVAAAGAIIGKKIAKAKLNHKSLSSKKDKTYTM